MMQWTEVKVIGETLTLAHDETVPVVGGHVDAKAGEVLSYGPLGWEKPRPAGTAQDYEKTERDSVFVGYRPVPRVNAVFPFRPKLANAPNLSAIAMSDPL